MDTMAAIRQTFFQECEDQLAEMESGLLAMNEGEADSETVNAVFRAVHSIKGGAGAFKLTELVQFAHIFETALDHVRSGKLLVCADVMKPMLRAADVLADLVSASRDGTAIDEAAARPLADELQALTGGRHGDAEDDGMSGLDFQPSVISFDDFAPSPIDLGGPAAESDLQAEPGKRAFNIRFKARPELYAKANESLLLMRELARVGNIEVACDTSAVPLLDALDPAGAYLDWSIRIETEHDENAVREAFEFVDGDCDLAIEAEGGAALSAETAAVTPAMPSDMDIAALLARVKASVEDTPPLTGSPAAEAPMREAQASPTVAADAAKSEGKAAAAASQAQATIRVEFERVDRLINLVGELVINQAMLSQRVLEADFPGSSAVVVGLEELEQLTREIQESVMAIRAQPVKPLFQRMSRIVREVAEATGKEVRLKTEGEATEIDKTVVERLADPLTHMIRNAVDHGLESPEMRVAAGKPAEGAVRLTAAHRSGRVVIEVSDDGAGINRPKVKASAIKKGLIPADAQLTDGEIDNLLFLPGFSTADTVSSISGRGVGMDVVKRSIQALGGRMSIASWPGKGSTFTMSLPLTLAVLDGMVVTVNDQTLVVPLTAIVETLKPKTADVHSLGRDARVMSIRNSFVPLIDVGRELGFRDHEFQPQRGVAILVESEGGARNALLVDGIQDQRQVVIKSLEANYGHVPGIAAATILGDGRVALILDVDALVARLHLDAPSAEPLLAVGA